MNTLLIVRSEILDILILIVLLIYAHKSGRYRQGKNRFLHMALMCFGHVLFGLFTEITVNTPSIPMIINYGCHIVFFTFSLLFIQEYFKYVVSLIFDRRIVSLCSVVGYILTLIFIVVILLSPLDYVDGNGTRYSMGAGVILCFFIGICYCLLTDLILIVHRKSFSRTNVMPLIPISITACILLIIQVFIPEFLFTPNALTLMVIGLFLAIENPADVLRKKAFIDADTGVYSRNCYEDDLLYFQSNTVEDPEFVSLDYVMIDINSLKAINDLNGHQAGDRAVALVASALQKNMQNVYRIYRIGGDEFAAVYINRDEAVIEKEVNNAKSSLASETVPDFMNLSFSRGIARYKKGEPFRELILRADQMMYKDKQEHYKQAGFDRRKR